MSEYTHYVAYRHATDEMRHHLEQTRRSTAPADPRPRGRHALALRLHALADRLDI